MHGQDITDKEFRREIAMTYLKTYHNKLKSAGRKPRVSTGVDSARYVRLNHLVVRMPSEKRRRCQRINQKSVVSSHCQKCNVGLCIPCFAPYHKNLIA